MNYCPYCGAKLERGMKFCSNCGRRLKTGFTPEERRRYVDELRHKSEGGTTSEAEWGKEKYHTEARNGSYEPPKPNAHPEPKLSRGSSHEHWPRGQPQKKSSRTLKIIAITGACIAVVAVVVVVIDPLTPSLYTGAQNLSLTVDNGLNPSPQAIYIASDHGAVDWFVVADTSWLSLDPLDGCTDKDTSITLSANIWGMYPGEYAATVTIFASAAKNTPIEIPVSLVITDTEETLAIKRAVGGDTGSLEVYYGKQPFYSGIDLINSQSATDPTWQRLLQFIASDDTDEQTYIEGVYVCGDFAETLHNNAEQKGIRAAWVAVDFTGSTEGHALNAFYTVDKGLVFVDCTGSGSEAIYPWREDTYSSDTDHDSIAYVQLGEEYGRVSADVATYPEYTFYEQYVQQWAYYENRVEEYNLRVEEYNRSVEEYNEAISRGTYSYGAMTIWYHDLQQELGELDREEEELNQLLEDLGYSRWEPLGLVSHVEVYW